MGDGLSALWLGERTVSRWALAARGRDSPRQQPEGLGSALRVPAGGVRFSTPPPRLSVLYTSPKCASQKEQA